jgi:hypothetical protein
MRHVVAALLLASSLVACTDEAVEEGSGSQSVVVDNRLAANRLAANRLAANRLAANRLAANRLAANRLELDPIGAGDLLKTPEGIELMNFIVGCALPSGVTLVAKQPGTGTQLEFFGEIGLAPKWETKPLDKKGQRWISACLYARVNANNVTVSVSLRGPHKSLATTADEVRDWPLQEAAFYGNYFRPVTEPIIWIACRGKDQAHMETGGLVDRDCAEPDPAHPGLTMCGFTYAGDCGDYDPPKSDHACRKFSTHGYWAGCQDASRFEGDNHWASHDDDDDDGDHDHDDDDDQYSHGQCDHHATYHQVITTFVQNQ